MMTRGAAGAMHITIPDAEEVTEVGATPARQRRGLTAAQGKKSYVLYNIHINGTYHCSARFSVLSKLHERLKSQFGAGCLEAFPPKLLMYVKPEQAAHRKFMLQNWLQKIGAQPIIVQGETFQNFLLNAQKEVQKGPDQNVQLEIFLLNSRSVKFDIVSTDQTDDVLETAISHIGLDADLTYYFGLFLVNDVTGKVTIRRLQDFESPYISLQRAESGHKLLLRKAYWDTRCDEQLLANPISLNLLYIETIADIRKGWIDVPDELAQQLAEHRAKKDRTAFLSVASQLKGYGRQCFGEAVSTYPQEGSTVQVSLGNGVLALVAENGKSYPFKVSSMRCWRTSSVGDTVELEFEFYFPPGAGESEGKMSWVKIVSPHTIHIAMCLQFLVEEMMRLRKSKPIRRPADRVGAFKPRRQKKSLDLNFLTSDDAAAAAAAAGGGDKPAGLRTLGTTLGLLGPDVKVSVTLSELKRKVKAEEEEQMHMDQGALAAAYKEARGAEKGREADPDDYDSDDDDKQAFASMAGLG